MVIFFVENWRELYKPGQIQMYLIEKKNRKIIDKQFDKLHEQKRMEWTPTATLFFSWYGPI